MFKRERIRPSLGNRFCVCLLYNLLYNKSTTNRTSVVSACIRLLAGPIHARVCWSSVTTLCQFECGITEVGYKRKITDYTNIYTMQIHVNKFIPLLTKNDQQQRHYITSINEQYSKQQAASLNRARQQARILFCTIWGYVWATQLIPMQNLMSYSCFPTPISYKGDEILHVSRVVFEI